MSKARCFRAASLGTRIAALVVPVGVATAPSPALGAGTLVGLNDRPVRSSLTFEKLQALLAEEKPANAVDTVRAIARRYPAYARNVAYVYESRSLQNSTRKLPRGILFGENGSLLIAFSHPESGSKAIEVLNYVESEGRFRPAEIRFGTGVGTVKKNPTACVACHGKETRPSWESHDVWPGAYGSIDDALDPAALPAETSPFVRAHVGAEKESFDAFLDFAKGDPLYSVVPHPATTEPPQVAGIVRPDPSRPNKNLVRFLNHWSVRSLAHKLHAANTPGEFRFALGATLVCGSPRVATWDLGDVLGSLYRFDASNYFSLIEDAAVDLGVRSKYAWLPPATGSSVAGSNRFPREQPGRIEIRTAPQLGTFNALLGFLGDDLRRYSPSFSPWGGRFVSPVPGVRHFDQGLELGRVFLDDLAMPADLAEVWRRALGAHSVVDSFFASPAGAVAPEDAIPEYRAAAAGALRSWCSAAGRHVRRAFVGVDAIPVAPLAFDAPRPPLQWCFSCHGDPYKAAHEATPGYPVSAWVAMNAKYAPSIPFHDTQALIRYLSSSPETLARALARVDPKSPGHDPARPMPPAPFAPLDEEESDSLRVVFKLLAKRKPIDLATPVE